MKPIVQKGAEVLHAKAEAILPHEFGSHALHELVSQMQAVLLSCPDGVGLAAPQIGISKQIFIISPRAYAADTAKKRHTIFINPRIVKLSKETHDYDEGCLSVRDMFGIITRSIKATVRAFDIDGHEFEEGASGLVAEIYQHETDHLKGVLFDDTARDLEKRRHKESLRVAFFGTPQFAVYSIQALASKGVVPRLVVTGQEKPQGRGYKIEKTPVAHWVDVWNEEHPTELITLWTPKRLDKQFAEDLKNWNPDMAIVSAYGKIIPEELLSIPRDGWINIHPSLLPKHRGATPLQSTILEGDREGGVTIMQMDSELDHGPIIGQMTMEIPTDATYEYLEETLGTRGGDLLAEIIPLWIQGKIEPDAQRHQEATFTKKITREMGYISQEKLGTPKADRTIRALSVNPGCYTLLKDKSGVEVRIKLLPGGFGIVPGKKKALMSDILKRFS